MGNSQPSQSYRIDGIPVSYKTYQSAANKRYVPSYSSSVCAPQKRSEHVIFNLRKQPGTFLHTQNGTTPVYEVKTSH